MLLLAVLSAPGAAPAATFEIDWQNGTLVISGEASSEGHADTVRTVAAALFPDARRHIALVRGETLPPGWSLVTEQALRLVAVTRSGQVTLAPDRVLLRSTYTDSAAWQQGLRRLSQTLLPGQQLLDQAVLIDTRRSFHDYCREQFAAATRDRRVDFRLNSSELRPSAVPLLDALVEIAADCPDAHILVNGHTDASGREEHNAALSQRRAQAVVAYMVGRGISAARLRAHGKGASQPLGDNASRAGRARNRRIEFVIRFAE